MLSTKANYPRPHSNLYKPKHSDSNLVDLLFEQRKNIKSLLKMTDQKIQVKNTDRKLPPLQIPKRTDQYPDDPYSYYTPKYIP